MWQLPFFAQPADGGVTIEQALSEADLQQIIGDQTDRIAGLCSEHALRAVAIADEQVDVYFMAVDSLQIRMPRDHFDVLFGYEEVYRGDAFVSATSGLMCEAVVQAEELSG